MRGLGVGYLKDPTCGLKGHFLGESPLSELPLGQFLGCLPFDGW